MAASIQPYEPENILYICVTDETLAEEYKEHILNHNQNVVKNHGYSDSGFDLLMPAEFIDTQERGKLINLGVKCVMNSNYYRPLARSGCKTYPFCIYPRSSISKTHLRMSNNVGIIDSGYRGNLKVAIDNVNPNGMTYNINKGTRYFQICLPSLEPFLVVLVSEQQFNMHYLNNGRRGEGGFGSTGR
jgi:dUTP pyrophosphatase